MTQTTIALYNSLADAQAAVNELVREGFDRTRISLIANDAAGEYSKYITPESREVLTDTQRNDRGFFGGIVHSLFGDLNDVESTEYRGVGRTISYGPLGGYRDNLVGGLNTLGLSADDSSFFAEGVRRGGALVAVETEEQWVEKAQRILNTHNPANYDIYRDVYRDEQYTGFDVEKTAPLTTEEITNYRNNVIPVVEEEIRVGKRKVENTGGVRIYTRLAEIPVEEQVTLRNERVVIERKPVDRPATEADLNAAIAPGEQATIVVLESKEEAVIEKSARVVEEITVGKTVDERVETVRDTVRKTEVEFENVNTGTSGVVEGYQTDASRQNQSKTTYEGGQQVTHRSDFESYRTQFRGDYDTNYASSGFTYEQYEPAYRYGYTSAYDTRYANRDWSAVESDLRRDWDRDYPDTPWEKFVAAVRRAWDTVRGAPESRR